MQSTLLIFAKPPRMGLAKTRLANDIGPTHAQRMNRYCHMRTMRAAKFGNWSTTICVAPDKDINFQANALWPNNFTRQPQGKGDLGERLAHAFKNAAPGPVLVIGTDAPDISSRDIKLAFSSLKRHDAVFGPADDGGFWLFGASPRLRRHALSFNPVRWSSQHTLSDLRKTFPPQTRTKLIHKLIDIDDGTSLSKWKTTSHY